MPRLRLLRSEREKTPRTSIYRNLFIIIFIIILFYAALDIPYILVDLRIFRLNDTRVIYRTLERPISF